MKQYIEGTIGENRVLEFTQVPVYIGEQGSSILKIDTGEIEDDLPDYYIILLETSAENGNFITNKIRSAYDSPAYIEDGIIYCPLTAEMTATGSLKVQVIAHSSDKDENDTLVKSSIAKLSFLPSLCSHADKIEYDKTVSGELFRLGKRLDKVDREINEFSFSYFTAAVGARLLFIDSVSTPVYFPETASDAEVLITELLGNYDYTVTRCVMVIIPTDSVNDASLCLIRVKSGMVSAECFSGAQILDLLKEGVDI